MRRPSRSDRLDPKGMGRARTAAAFGSVVVLFAWAAGCSSGDETTCGPGTTLSGSACVPVTDAADVAAAPTFAGVAAVAPVSPTSVFATWNDARSPSTPPERMRYAVFAVPAGTPIDYAKPLATSEPGAASFSLKGLDPSTTYDVAVRAVDDAGRSDDNTIVKSIAPARDTTPPAFAGVTEARPGGAGSVVLRWEPARDDLTPPEAIVYYVYRASPAGTFDFAMPSLVTRPGAGEATVKGLYDGQQLYRFVVRARDAAENVDANEESVSSRAGPDVAPPSFAGCKTALAQNAGSVVVTWDPASDDTTPADEIAYDVYAAKQEGGFDFTAPLASVTGTTNVRLTGLASNTTWRFVCRARDFSGNRDTNLVERVAKTLVDDTPPTFGGLLTVQVDSLARSVRFGWAPGSDDKTPASELVYDVFEGEASGEEDFTLPRASSAPGALEVVVTDLTPDRKLYWVVRARDQGGNHDTNTVEASGTTAVSFERQIQPILSYECAVSGCHVPGNPMAGLVLAAGFSYGQLVNVPSTEVPSMLRVNPGDPATSYLWLKISKNPPPSGWQMPAPATGSVMPASEQDLIQRWILQGAASN